jgi:hypothetical protein
MRVFFILLMVTTACYAGESKRRAVVHDGSTIAKAIVITAPMGNYVDVEWDWIARHYPDAMMVPGHASTFVDRGRWYAGISFTTTEGKPKTIYFDITAVK